MMDTREAEVVDTFVARICYSTVGWVRPCGVARDFEQGTHTASYGYGHEEWLFDFSTLIDGWKYGSVEIRGHRYAGQMVKLYLFTRGPEGTVLVGWITRCHVLTEEEARYALDEHRDRGWLDEMIRDVKAIGGDPDVLMWDAPTAIFRVRFRPEDYHPVEGVVVAPRGTWVAGLKRYQHNRMRPEAEALFAPAAPAAQERNVVPSERTPVAAAPVFFRHNEIQNRLAFLLRQRYASVQLEVGGVDIQVDDPAFFALIEVKPTLDPRLAVREALGQLLEYAHFDAPALPSQRRLIVAAPGRTTTELEAYLESLGSRYGLPLAYVEANASMLTLPAGLEPSA